MAVAASETFTSTSAPIQYAAVRAFEGGPLIERYLTSSRRVLGALAGAITGRLRDAGLSVPDAEGGFYLFPDFEAHRDRLAERGVTSSVGLCDALLEATGVAILPGSHFGLPPGDLAARIAYVDFDGGQALAMAEASTAPLDDTLLRGACGRTMTAIDHLCEWLT